MKHGGIDIFNFDGQREFLAAVIADRKQRNTAQSLRQLAKRAGFKSPATLSMIVTGKRGLSQPAAEKIAKALALVGRRKRYFFELSKLDRAKTEVEKTKVREELYRLKSAAEENLMDIRQYRCLAVWYYPVIYSMIGQANFKADPNWISMRLKEEVSPAQVQEALNDMEEVGMIKKAGETWEQVSGPMTTRDDIKDAGIFSYHNQMLDRAKRSLELPLQDRELNGVTVCISPQQLPIIKEKIRKFRKDLNEYLSQFKDSSDVYQLNIQFFPHTQKEKSK